MASDLYPNFFKKLIFKKVGRYQQNHEKIPSKHAKISNLISIITVWYCHSIYELNARLHKSSHVLKIVLDSIYEPWQHIRFWYVLMYNIVEQRRFRQTCPNAKTSHSLHCSYIHGMDVDEESELNIDPLAKLLQTAVSIKIPCDGSYLNCL